MSSVVCSLVVFLLMIGVSNGRRLRQIVDDKDPGHQRRRLSIKDDENLKRHVDEEVVPLPSKVVVLNKITASSTDSHDDHQHNNNNKTTAAVTRNIDDNAEEYDHTHDDHVNKTKFEETSAMRRLPQQIIRCRKNKYCGRTKLKAKLIGSATTKSGKYSPAAAAAKFSWRLPRKKRGVVPQMGFNLDYAPPRVHPPRHN